MAIREYFFDPSMALYPLFGPLLMVEGGWPVKEIHLPWSHLSTRP
jgi:hypothetical protein